MVCWTACSIHLLVGEEVGLTESDALAEVFALLQPSDGATATLKNYLNDEVGRKYLWYGLVLNYLHLDLLIFLRTSWVSFGVLCAMPLSLCMVTLVSPSRVMEVLAMAIVVVFYTTGLSHYMALCRRRQFATDYQLQRTLEKEAAALKEAAQQEAALKEASQEADTILNHVLKNVMADAAGCVHLYLQSQLPNLMGLPADLLQATECLERGVAWCRKRQALLRIAAGKYTPQLCDVDLTQFGQSLLQGRPIEANFPDEVVHLDPLLCEIVLENALTNAQRHGHPTQPGLHFTAALTSLPGVGPTATACGIRQLLTFVVTNRVHPSRPPLTPELVASLLRGDTASLDSLGSATPRLSEHLGMLHLVQAARAHNMELHLQQVGDTVYFEAALEVTLMPFTDAPHFSPKENCVMVPPNLRVFCVDDSSVARRLLIHTLSGEPMRAAVTAYGKTPEEVAQFLDVAPGAADIVVLDYHLDYGPVTFLGTDLVRALLERGYRGLVCIRSANATAYDEAQYIEAGAHCCIGKDVHPQAMAQALMAAYRHRPSPSLGSAALFALQPLCPEAKGMDSTVHCGDQLAQLPGVRRGTRPPAAWDPRVRAGDGDAPASFPELPSDHCPSPRAAQWSESPVLSPLPPPPMACAEEPANAQAVLSVSHLMR
eukprot:EG_transcript_5166